MFGIVYCLLFVFICALSRSHDLFPHSSSYINLQWWGFPLYLFPPSSAVTLTVSWKRPQVCHETPIYLLPLMKHFPGIYTTKHLASTLASSSSDEMSQAMRRIWNWGLDMHTLLCGTHITSISVTSPICKRFVAMLVLCGLQNWCTQCPDEHM